MQWFLRSVIVIAVIVILIGLVRHEWILQWKADPNRDEADHSEPIAEMDLNNDDANGVPFADDTGNPPPTNLKNPITQGLSRFIDGQNTILGDSGDSLQETLNQSDALLYQAKQSNRNAMREANRQVRIRHVSSNTPDIVFVVVSGLHLDDLGCFGGDESTSGFDSLAVGGIRQKITGISDERAIQNALLSGEATIDEKQNLLTPTFWQAGYTTAIIGDGSPWRVSDTADVDFWFGSRTASERHPYPKSMWSNGAEMKLPGNSDGKQGIAAHQLFADEAVDFVARYRSRNPYFLTISVDLASQFPEDWDQPEKVAATSQMIVALEESLATRKWTRQTLFVVAGIPEDGSDGPLLARWPGRLAPNLSIIKKADYQDLPKTLLQLVSANRRPQSLLGSTLAKTWLARPASP